MIDDMDFEGVALKIMAQGFDEEKAWDYAVIIGDMPIIDQETGKWLVVQDDVVLASLDPLF